LQGAVSHFGHFVGQEFQRILAVRRIPKKHVRGALVFVVISNYISCLELNNLKSVGPLGGIFVFVQVKLSLKKSIEEVLWGKINRVYLSFSKSEKRRTLGE